MNTACNEVRDRAANRVDLHNVNAFDFTDDDEFVSRLGARRIDIGGKEKRKEPDRPSFFIGRRCRIRERQLKCGKEKPLLRMGHRYDSAPHLRHASLQVGVNFGAKQAHLHGQIDIPDDTSRKEGL